MTFMTFTGKFKFVCIYIYIYIYMYIYIYIYITSSDQIKTLRLAGPEYSIYC